jgi:hypothetical protein
MEDVKLASCHERLAHQFIEAERAFSDTETRLVKAKPYLHQSLKHSLKK